MIRLSDAQRLIAEHTMRLSVERRMLDDVLGCVLAEDLRAPIDLPPFDNSAVDGFAVARATLGAGFRLKHDGLVRAQGQIAPALHGNTAIKITTGAPIPEAADAVVMLEHVVLERDDVVFSSQPMLGENIRLRAEDLRKGTIFARRGAIISPQLIGLSAALGMAQLPVMRKPRVAIISTGDELVQPGQPLMHGQVYYLMGPMLKAQCAQLGINDVCYELVADDQYAIIEALERARDIDIVLFTGGMSKGDYDHVRAALRHRQCQEIFYQGAWRPGKPLYFGERDHTLIFGLPGNPVAAFVCFHIFVRRALMNAFGVNVPEERTAIATNDFTKKSGVTVFARARVRAGNQLHFLAGQGSHQIFSLSEANALCVVPEEETIIRAGDMVSYVPI